MNGAENSFSVLFVPKLAVVVNYKKLSVKKGAWGGGRGKCTLYF